MTTRAWVPQPARRNLAALLSGLARPLPGSVRGAGRHDEAHDLPHVLRRIGAAGHPPEVASALAALWPTLAERTRRQIADPLQPDGDGYLRFGSRRAVQTSTTTCGSAVLVALLAAGDPVTATWLMTGRRLGTLPRELAPAAGAAADDTSDRAPVTRFSAAQGAMQRATSRQALLLWAWPTRFGTPPWTAARHARFPGVAYGHRPVDDTDRDEMAQLLAWVAASLGRGVPVPLYTGGDLVRGVRSAVPRHVVLAVPPGPSAAPGTIALYEPTKGRVHEVGPEDLVARSEPHPALGQWTHLCWAVLPHAVRTDVRPGAGALR